MEGISLDLRERIIKTWEQGEAKTTFARLFMVSLSSVKRFVKQFQTEGHVRPKIQRLIESKLMNRQWRKRLAQQLEADKVDGSNE